VPLPAVKLFSINVDLSESLDTGGFHYGTVLHDGRNWTISTSNDNRIFAHPITNDPLWMGFDRVTGVISIKNSKSSDVIFQGTCKPSQRLF
jgi:hypothetical protein